MSARGASELCAYMAHPFYAVFRKDKVTLWLVPTFLTKVISMYHVSQTTILSVFFCAPSTLKERALCCLGGPRALSFYLAHTVSFCMDPHLFITYGAPSIGCPVFPQNLAGWIKATVKLLSIGSQAHNWFELTIKAFSVSTVFLQGISLQDICVAATWSSPLMFDFPLHPVCLFLKRCFLWSLDVFQYPCLSDAIVFLSW